MTGGAVSSSEVQSAGSPELLAYINSPNLEDCSNIYRVTFSPLSISLSLHPSISPSLHPSFPSSILSFPLLLQNKSIDWSVVLHLSCPFLYSPLFLFMHSFFLSSSSLSHPFFPSTLHSSINPFLHLPVLPTCFPSPIPLSVSPSQSIYHQCRHQFILPFLHHPALHSSINSSIFAFIHPPILSFIIHSLGALTSSTLPSFVHLYHIPQGVQSSLFYFSFHSFSPSIVLSLLALSHLCLTFPKVNPAVK